MSKITPSPEAPESAAISAEIEKAWLDPFLQWLAKERRYSPHTVRNYRQAFVDFYAWLSASGMDAHPFDELPRRQMRSSIVSLQRRF